jgi:hypothetical protein
MGFFRFGDSSENLDVVMKENSVILLEDNYKENYNGFDPSSYTGVLTQEVNMEDSIDLAALRFRIILPVKCVPRIVVSAKCISSTGRLTCLACW